MCGLRVDIQFKVFVTVLEFWILLSRDTTGLTHFDTLWEYHITNIFYFNSTTTSLLSLSFPLSTFMLILITP